MKKLLKKVLSVAAATALLMTSVISATATSASGPTYDADKKYTINITASGDKDVKDYPEHLYAFQIFSGTVPDEQKNADEDGNVTNPGTLNTTLQLTDIKWGTGIKSDKDSLTALMGALSDAPAFKENSIFTGFVTGNSTSGYTLSSTYLDSENNVLADKLAVAVANVLSEKLVNNRQYMQYFTDIVGGYKSSDSTLNNFLSSTYLTAELSTDDDSPIWKFNDVSAGYYLILANDLRQVSGSPTPPEGAAFPARMLFVASNVSQQIKESVPVFDKFVVRNSTVDDKKVESNSNLKDTAVAGVGDVVEFQLRGTLPTNFEKYDVYQYIFTDTLDKGLDAVRYSDDATFDAADSSSVKVRIIGAFEKVSSASGDNIVTYTDPVTGEVSYWIWDDDIVLTLGYEGKATVNNPTPSNGYTLTYSTLTEPTASIDKRQLTITFEDLIKLRLEQDSKTYRVGFYYEGTVEGSDDYHVHNGGLDEIHSSKILVNYKAKLNKDAVVAPKNGGNLNGNLNEAYLTYSDDPSDQTKVDNTVTEDATVYTFGLTITKEDYASKLNDTVVKKLPNAEFTFLRKTGDLADCATDY